MLSVRPNVCVASGDSFLGQHCLLSLAECSDALDELSCVYDFNHAQPFLDFMEKGFEKNPGSKLAISTRACQYGDPAQLNNCFNGVSCVLICPPAHMDRVNMVRWCECIVEACKSAKVGNIVLVSSMGGEEAFKSASEPNAVLETKWSGVNCEALARYWQCELICRKQFPDCPIVRCSFLAQWCAGWVQQCNKSGTFEACWGVHGEGAIAPVDADDVARACAEIICAPPNLDQGSSTSQGSVWCLTPKHTGRVYNLTGPTCYDAHGFANCFGKACKKPSARYQPCSVAECRVVLKNTRCDFAWACGSKFSEWETEMVACWMAWAAQGECGWVSDDLAILCGGEGSSLSDWLTANVNKICA